MSVRSFYRFSAIYISAMLLPMAAVKIWVEGFNGPTLEHMPFAIRFPMSTVGIIWFLLFLTLWIGMIYDCLFISKFPVHQKIFWFLFIVIGVWLGLLVYYFVVFEGWGTRRVLSRPPIIESLHNVAQKRE